MAALKVSVISALAVSLLAAGCSAGSPRPNANSPTYQTTDELITALRSAGVCEGTVRWEQPLAALEAIKPLGEEGFALCADDGIVVTFFTPAEDGSITALFPAIQCELGVEDVPLVWGPNFQITPRGTEASEDVMARAAEATGASLTTTSAAVEDFCKELRG